MLVRILLWDREESWYPRQDHSVRSLPRIRLKTLIPHANASISSAPLAQKSCTLGRLWHAADTPTQRKSKVSVLLRTRTPFYTVLADKLCGAHN